MSASIFLSGAPIVKSAAQKKVSRVANRVPKSVRVRRASGPVTVFVPLRQEVKVA